jgi:hypothetical protein
MFSTFTEATDWVVKIPANLQSSIWEQHQSIVSTWSKWNRYLNQVCLETCLLWLQAETISTATAWSGQGNFPELWNVVNGSIITVGATRFALIPTESIDQTSIDVPQEWVDIPGLVADYYLAVQVALESQELRIYGYTTHRQLKQDGVYDADDRTYCLDVEALNIDLNALWLSYAHQGAAQVRAALTPITPLSNAQVDRWIDQLGNSTEAFRRLEIPFQAWAALIENPVWRTRLGQTQPSIGSTPLLDAVTRLNQWFHGQVDAAWQSLDQVLIPQPVAIAIRSRVVQLDQMGEPGIYRVKVFSLEGIGQIALVLGVAAISDTENSIELQVLPAGGASDLPGATQLRLLTIDNQELGKVSADMTETIELEFRVNQGERFQIEITCEGQTIIEQFEL